jgi:arylsulfatase A-like enzyme
MGKRLTVGKSKWELYDLSKDLSEENNLSASQPERLAELIEIWEKRNGEMSEPLF